MSPRHTNFPLISTSLTLAAVLAGCVVQLPGNLDVGDEDATDETGDDEPGDGDPGDSGDGDPGDGDPGDGPIDGDGCQEAVDILFVIDNSGSMGPLQRRLALSVGELLASLDDAGVDWRLAMTTTDVGNPWCPAEATTPEMGAFQLQACNDHLEDFVFNSGETDISDVACTQICPYAPNKLHTLATTTAQDPQPSPRPWIERIDGESNLPENIDPTVASSCLVPQGINGCGFESPLEAMHLALQRASDPMYPEAGFLRDEASLLIVFVSDETDCSDADPFIFDPASKRTFWSDPQASTPTSAVCWNAGISCTGDPDGYEDCVATNFDIDGAPTTPDQAVLHPVARYVEQLDAIEQQKRALDPGADVAVLVLGGLALDGSLVFANDLDPAFQNSFGIGAGCVAQSEVPSTPIAAVPPGRMREVAEATTSAPLASICAPDYAEAFGAASERLLGSCE